MIRKVYTPFVWLVKSKLNFDKIGPKQALFYVRNYMTSRLSQEQKQLLSNRLHECISHANHVLKLAFPLPSLTFNQRGKVAGTARYISNEIRLNSHLAADNLDYFLEEVIPHEVCHLVAYALFGKVQPHGKQWKGLMQQLFGLEGKTCHQLDVSMLSHSIDYFCACGPVALSIRRHNKVLRQQTQYRCRTCNTILQPNLQA